MCELLLLPDSDATFPSAPSAPSAGQLRGVSALCSDLSLLVPSLPPSQ